MADICVCTLCNLLEKYIITIICVILINITLFYSELASNGLLDKSNIKSYLTKKIEYRAFKRKTEKQKNKSK